MSNLNKNILNTPNLIDNSSNINNIPIDNIPNFIDSVYLTGSIVIISIVFVYSYR
jgi:hypothetical protein